MEIGIIGLPNVGKSTLFNALTNSNVPAENFPFTTIEPNVGIVPLPDVRLAKLGEIFNPQKLTPAPVKFIDIAGLVKGASSGQGLGNKFLSHIREVDAVLQVVRLFGDKRVAGILTSVNPEEEISIIETELILADLEKALGVREKISGLARCGNKEAKLQIETLEKLIDDFNKSMPARSHREATASFGFLTSKEIMYVLNSDDNTSESLIENTVSFIEKEKHSYAVAVNASLEYELTRMESGEKEIFKKELGIEKSAIEEIVKRAYKALGLITFYTVVGTEVRAWPLKEGTTAKTAAGKIHTDMEKGFIKAEVYQFEKLVESGSEKALQEKGLIRNEGRDYVIKDGDVVKIKFQQT